MGARCGRRPQQGGTATFFGGGFMAQVDKFPAGGCLLRRAGTAGAGRVRTVAVNSSRSSKGRVHSATWLFRLTAKFRARRHPLRFPVQTSRSNAAGVILPTVEDVKVTERPSTSVGHRARTAGAAPRTAASRSEAMGSEPGPGVLPTGSALWRGRGCSRARAWAGSRVRCTSSAPVGAKRRSRANGATM